MRLRNIPGAKDAITGSNYVVQEPASHKGKWAQVFPKDQPLHIEVGMGKGRFLMDMAKLHPEINYVGIEMYDSVLLRALQKRERLEGEGEKLTNLMFMWRKRDIQKRCEHQAHRNGMRISRICAWNTSRLAYDGTGTVAHDSRNHSLCVFQTGKRYNCDLSASYNIGARYFIRELLPPSGNGKVFAGGKSPCSKT